MHSIRYICTSFVYLISSRHPVRIHPFLPSDIFIRRRNKMQEYAILSVRIGYGISLHTDSTPPDVKSGSTDPVRLATRAERKGFRGPLKN